MFKFSRSFNKNIVDYNKIIIDWFHKKTFSGHYLSFYFNHSTYHKIGATAICSLVEASFSHILVSPKEFRINYQRINYQIILTDNGYSLNF